MGDGVINCNLTDTTNSHFRVKNSGGGNSKLVIEKNSGEIVDLEVDPGGYLIKLNGVEYSRLNSTGLHLKAGVLVYLMDLIRFWVFEKLDGYHH